MAKFAEIVIAPDTRANQPAATAVPVGALYCVTDEDNILERSNGTTWDPYSPSGAPAGVILADGSVPMAADLDLGGNKIVDVDDPAAAQDAATKAYVDAAIAALLGSKVAAAGVATNEASPGTSYGDPTTPGPAVTVTTGTSALVALSCNSIKSATGNSGFMSFAVSGASSIAASDARCAFQSSALAGGGNCLAVILLITGLTPGSNTFTAKYRDDGGTWTFLNRWIAVFAL